MVVTVGVRGFRGALVAGMMFTIFPALFQYVHVTGIGQLPTVLFGLGAIGLAREPRGFLYEMEMRFRRKRPAPPGRGRTGERRTRRAGTPAVAGLPGRSPAMTDRPRPVARADRA